MRCPECGGEARPEGITEREPVRCADCGRRYRNPRLALLLSLALPGLGSLYLGRRIWGGAVLLSGTAAFGWTVFRMYVHIHRAWVSSLADIGAIVADSTLGVVLVLLSYSVDVLVLWLRRGSLVELKRS